MPMRAITLSLLGLCLGLSALDVPPVPDPIGLGTRLALIDYLKDHHLPVPAHATVEQLQVIYEQAWRNEPANAVAVAQERERQADADRLKRLRERIETVHGVKPDPQADEPTLRAQLVQLDAARTAAKEQEIARLLEADRQRARTAPRQEDAPPAQPDATKPAIRDPVAATPTTSKPATTPDPAPAPTEQAEQPKAKERVYSPSEFGHESAKLWENWGAEPTSSRDNCSVQVFIRVGDQKSYYLLVRDRGGSKVIDADIGGETFTIDRAPANVQVVTPKSFKSRPDITLRLRDR